jgi:signal transduction histidine kinase
LLNHFQADIDAVGRIACVPAVLDVVCRTTGMGLAAVARVADDRWVAMKVLDRIDFGLFPGGELEIAAAIRNAACRPETMAIDDIAADQRFGQDPMPGFRSYIATPILLGDGSSFGVLAAMDPQPARVDNPETISTLELFAELIARHLDAGRALAATEQRLMDERVAHDLRERFIAILGHDLRNPLASIQAGTKRIARLSDDEQITVTLSLMQKSIEHLANLIDNVMDFARGLPAGGMEFSQNTGEPLEPVLVHILDERRAGWPERQIDADLRLSHPVSADRARLGQLFANLIDNALMHGSDEGAIRVHASTESGEFVLWVANPGLPIAAERLERLFKPFSRDDVQGKPGLGLGLYVAAEIARAHGGELSVSSTPEETRFTFRMPIGNHKG